MFRVTRAALSVYRSTPVWRETWKKTSTGLVGLPVDPNARANMIKAQKAVLEKVKILPEGVAYREAIEALTNFRLKVAENSKLTDEEVEDQINAGQLEELIETAKTEVDLLQFYFDEKMWERVEAVNKMVKDKPNVKPWEW